MIKKALTALTLLSSSAAHAMTGSEFLEADRYFAYGYMTGVVDMRVTVMHSDDESFTTIRDCVVASKISTETLYGVVVTRLRNHPNELTIPALGAILNVLSEMCVR